MNDLLSQLGLNKGEISIYKYILKAKRIGPSELSNHTKINRTTVYSITKSLLSKGFIVEDLGSGKKEYTPVGPTEIKSILKREEDEHKKKEQLFKKLAEELTIHFVGQQYDPPKIRFIEEEKINEYLYSRNKIWNDSILSHDKHWWGFQDHTFVENHERWVGSFWKQSAKDLKLRLLSNESDIEKQMRGRHPNREIKYWNKGNFTATTWVVGDYLVLIRTSAKPYYLVEIHDSVLASNMRELFKNIWDLV